MFKLVVLSCMLAAAAAAPSLGLAGLGLAGPLGIAGVGPLGVGPLGVGPLGLAGVGPLGLAGVGRLGLGAPWGAPWGASLHSPVVAAPGIIGAYNYRGPLSLAPGQPANILAADGRPLDTLSVNLDRAAHITAQAVNGAHILRKRSAPLWGAHALAAPLAVSHSSRIDLPARIVGPGHLGLAGPIGPLGVAPLGVAPLGLGLGHAGLAGLGPAGLGLGPAGLGLGHAGLGLGPAGLGLGHAGLGLGHGIW